MKLPIGTFTFYNALENCPHACFHRYIGRTVSYVRTPEMAWGDDVHRAIENRIKHGSPLPDVMQAAERAASAFHEMGRHVPVEVELQLAMTQTGAPCDWDKAWFRGKLDCVVLAGSNAWMVDWKTGNVREDPFELQCGALLLKIHHPELQQVSGEYFWLKSGQNGLRYTITDHANTYHRLLKLRQQAEEYLQADNWPKRKSPLCDWCAVKSCENYTGKHVK